MGQVGGWSDNPNQFALLALLVGFLSLELVEKSIGIGPKLLAAFCGLISLGIGWLGQSNAYSGVIFAAFGLFGLLRACAADDMVRKAGFPGYRGWGGRACGAHVRFLRLCAHDRVHHR